MSATSRLPLALVSFSLQQLFFKTPPDAYDLRQQFSDASIFAKIEGLASSPVDAGCPSESFFFPSPNIRPVLELHPAFNPNRNSRAYMAHPFCNAFTVVCGPAPAYSASLSTRIVRQNPACLSEKRVGSIFPPSGHLFFFVLNGPGSGPLFF